MVDAFRFFVATMLLIFLVGNPENLVADEPVELLADTDYRSASPADQLARLKDLQDAKQPVRDEGLLTNMAMVAYCLDKGAGDSAKLIEALAELLEMEKSGGAMPQMGFRRGQWDAPLFILPLAEYLHQNEKYQDADGPGKIRILSELPHKICRSNIKFFVTTTELDSQFEAVKDVPLSERGMARLQILKKLREAGGEGFPSAPVDWALNEHLVHNEAWEKATPIQRIKILMKLRDAGLLGTGGMGTFTYEKHVIPWVIAALDSDPDFVAADFEKKRQRLKSLFDRKVTSSLRSLQEHYQIEEGPERMLDAEPRMRRDKAFLALKPLEQLHKIVEARDEVVSFSRKYYDGMLHRALIAHLQADDGDQPPTPETEVLRFRRVMEQLNEMRGTSIRNTAVQLNLLQSVDYQVNATILDSLKDKDTTDILARSRATTDWYRKAYEHENNCRGDVGGWLWLSALARETADAKPTHRGAARLDAILTLEREMPFNARVGRLEYSFAAYAFAVEKDLIGSKTNREAAELLGQASFDGGGNLAMVAIESAFWIRVFEKDDDFLSKDSDARKVVYDDHREKKRMSFHAAINIEKYFKDRK